MRIVLATPIYPPEIGGPATYAKELSERLKDTYDITVVAYTDVHDDSPKIKFFGVNKHNSLPIRLLKYFLVILKVSKNADIVYVQNAMAAGFPVALACLFTKKPFVVKIVGDEAWERAVQNRLTKKSWEEFLVKPEGGLWIKLMMSIQKFVLRRAAIVTTPSLYMIEEIVKAYGVEKSRMIVNYNAAEKEESIPFEATVVPYQIATTARLIELKNIDGIIKALALVKKEYPEARLVIGGDGPEMDRLKSLTKELDLENDVDFLGKISRAETWHLRKVSEIYVINSSHEGLPITLLTSLASGTPIVATNVVGTNEVVYHEETGLLVELGDTEALAKAICRLLGDKKLQKKLVDNGFKLLEKKFSWDSHLRILEEILQSVLSKPRNKV